MKSMNSPQAEFELKYEGTVMQVKDKLHNTEGLCVLTHGETEGWPAVKVAVKGPALPGMPSIAPGHHNMYNLSAKRFLPDSGYYNTPTMAIYLSRKATKQWKNSYCNSIYSVFPALNYAKGEAYHGELSIFSKSTLKALRSKYYYSIGKAASRLDNKVKSCAISASICLIRGASKKILVVYNSYTVGEYIRGTVSTKGYVIPIIDSPAIYNLLKSHDLPVKEEL